MDERPSEVIVGGNDAFNVALSIETNLDIRALIIICEEDRSLILIYLPHYMIHMPFDYSFN
jgi:hypothetical protein